MYCVKCDVAGKDAVFLCAVTPREWSGVAPGEKNRSHAFQPREKMTTTEMCFQMMSCRGTKSVGVNHSLREI